MAELLSALRPLVVWMSNALELLNFIQHQLPPLLAWRSRREQQEVGEEEEDIGNEFHLCDAIKLINNSTYSLLNNSAWTFLYPQKRHLLYDVC